MEGLNRVIAGIVLSLLAPVMLLIMSLIRSTMGSPVFFRQVRAGFRGKPFIMYKFRTMIDPVDGGRQLPDEERITRVGSFLRKTSLDELPELYNVLKGDMNFVGPRPLLMEYLPLYTREQARRHDIKPGITGWAQVNGRNAVSWEDKFRYDQWYVMHRSFRLDMRIILKTLSVVLKREGVSQAGHATMPVFKGSPERPAHGTRD